MKKRNLKWNKRAISDFKNIQLRLTKEFGAQIERKFTKNTFELIESIVLFPEIGKKENPRKRIRSLAIHKRTLLFYRIDETNLVILALFDTRQNTSQKKY